LLDIYDLVSEMNKLKLLCWVPSIFFGQHLRLKQVEFSGQSETERKLDVYADDEHAAQTPVEIYLSAEGCV
jgi:hypothetical protein